MNEFKYGVKRACKQYFMPLYWLVAAVFLIEEAIWDWTAKKMERLGAIAFIHHTEQRIAVLSPYAALGVFITPSLVLLPLHVIEFYTFENGHWVWGILALVSAKLISVGLFARIFNLTKPALLQLDWFTYIYCHVMAYRNKLHAYLDEWFEYQLIKIRIKEWIERTKG